MSEHAVFSEGMTEIVESFVVETHEIFDELNDDLLQLEHAEDRAALVDKVFRAVHTVKGTSSFLGLDQLNLLAHHFEDVLNRLRKGDLAFHPGMMDTLFAAYDQMSGLLQQVFDRKIEQLPIDGVLSDLRRLASEGRPADHDVPPASASADPASKENTVELPNNTNQPNPPRPASSEWTRKATGSIRVEIERLDDLFSLVGELALSRRRLDNILEDLAQCPGINGELIELAATASQVDDITTKMRTAVLRARMVPIDRIFSKFPRVARDLGRSLDKGIEIVTKGAETEVDKVLADEIGEPLLHLIRNAIDHGIERRDVRRSLSKPEVGRILLRAEQHGTCVTISVEDDGAGIDPENVRRKAVAKQIITQEEAARLTDGEIHDLIWRPGFTTTDHVSDLSGRGVGMDVVKTTVNRLNGTIDIESTPGIGTRFSLRLPVTVGMIPSLLVGSRTETFAVPLQAVDEVLSASADSMIEGKPLANIEGALVPVICPTTHVANSRTADDLLVVLNAGKNRFALLVDRLEGEENLVVKPRADAGSDIEMFAGSAVLADGRTVMVFDVNGIGRRALEVLETLCGLGADSI